MEFPFTQSVDDYEMKKKHFLSLAEGPRITSAAVLGYQVHMDKDEKKEFENRMKLINENLKQIQTKSEIETNNKEINFNSNVYRQYPVTFNQKTNYQHEVTNKYDDQYEHNKNSNKINFTNQYVNPNNLERNPYNYGNMDSNVFSKNNIAVTRNRNFSILNNHFRLNDLKSYDNPSTTNIYSTNNPTSNFYQSKINCNLHNNNKLINYNDGSNPKVRIDNLNESSIRANSSVGYSSFVSQSILNILDSQDQNLRPEIGRKKAGKKAKKGTKNVNKETQPKKVPADMIKEFDNYDQIYFEEEDHIVTNNMNENNLSQYNINNSVNISRENPHGEIRHSNFMSQKSICVDSIANKVFNENFKITKYTYSEKIIFIEHAISKTHLAMKFSFSHSKSKIHVMYFYHNLHGIFDSIQTGKVYEAFSKRIYQGVVGLDGLVEIYMFLGFK